jgi:hypothetical protein
MSSDTVGVVVSARTAALARPASSTRTLTVDVAILLATAAGLAHLLSTPEHWRWWQASGVFFAVLAALQLGLAIALFFRRADVGTVTLGIWTNVMAVAVYVASRLSALPGQPVVTAHHSPKAPGRAFLPAQPEGVGAFDMFALVVEVALIVLLVGLLPPTWRSRTSTALMCCGLAFCAFAAWVTMAHGTIG